MPLIILSGYPCTGKTTFADKLAAALRSGDVNRNVITINEDSLHMNKREYFNDASKEKLLRQNLKSAVDHALNADTFVILDSLNYIKGFRYELYCIARSQRTPHCVVLVQCDLETTSRWNAEKGDDAYPMTLMEDLRMRFERPNEANRWDKPLFVVNTSPAASDRANSGSSGEVKSTDPPRPHPAGGEIPEAEETEAAGVFATSSWTSKKSKKKGSAAASVCPSTASVSTAVGAPKGVYFSGSLNVSTTGGSTATGNQSNKSPEDVIDDIVVFFDTAAVPVPNAATMQVKHADAELLYQLDRVSQAISQAIVSHQQNHSDGTPLLLKEYNSQVVELPRYISLAEVQRLRRQFVKINSQHPPENSVDVGAKFVEFLLNQLQI